MRNASEPAAPDNLPTEVVEQPTSKTSVYRQGELIYDGATGRAVGSGVDDPQVARGGSSATPGGSLNEMLKWSIENSDPEELQRRAVDGGAPPPSQFDKEVMDMLMGEPTVAKMRACMVLAEPEALRKLEGVDKAIGAMEELGYYAEDIDAAVSSPPRRNERRARCPHIARIGMKQHTHSPPPPSARRMIWPRSAGCRY